MIPGRNKVLVSEYFELADFEYPDTGEVILHSVLLDALNGARRRLQEPVVVLKGYVPPAAITGGQDGPEALHAFGCAVVIATPSPAYKDALVIALQQDARVVVTDLGEGVRVEVGGLR